MNFFKNEKLKFLKNRKLLIIIGILLVVGITGFLILRGKAVKTSGSSSVQRTAVASYGTLNVTLSGSGAVTPSQKKNITVEVAGEVEESFLTEGKAVKEGDILLQLKDTDAQLALKKLENDINQKGLSVSNQNLQDGVLSINAPISGRVSDLNVSKGDIVTKGMPLMTLVDESSLQANVTFEGAVSSQFNGIKTVQLQIPDFMAALTGQIKSLVQDGSNVHAVITIENPGAIKSGTSVWAEASTRDGLLTSTQGTLEVKNKVQIIAEASGTVSDLMAYSDQTVNSGKLLLTISGDELVYEIEGGQLDLEQAYIELQQAKDNLENYTIRAPFDGFISSITDLVKGERLKADTSVGTIMNTDEMTFQVSIDELDISQVQINQKAFVTVEALDDTSNKPIEGIVTSIASEGTSSNGVTSYPVTVTIPGRENLKSGMNVDAVIQILNKENTLLVPIEAVQKQGNGYIVWVKGKEQQTQQRKAEPSTEPSNNEENTTQKRKMVGSASLGGATGYYSGAAAVRVTIGNHNETLMEITEGLNEGDIVILPELVSNSSNSNSTKSQTSFMPIGGGGFVRETMPNVKRGN